jgi:hypothetical protein
MEDAMENSTSSAGCGCPAGAAAAKYEGRFRLLPQLVQVDFENGASVTAPASEAMTVSAAALGDTIGPIIDIACRIFPTLCGGGGGGGGGGCYVIKGPDGTTITICPPGHGIAIA